MIASVALRKLRLSPVVPALTSDTRRSLLAIRSSGVAPAQAFDYRFHNAVVSGQRSLATIELLVDTVDHVFGKADGHWEPVADERRLNEPFPIFRFMLSST